MLPQVVFIHTNTYPPLHLILNYRRAAAILNKGEVWLLHDGKYQLKKFFPKEITFPRNFEEAEVDIAYKYPKSLRSNFWFSSLVRFSLLARFMNSNDRPTIHVESDVVLAEDFPVEKFSHITKPFAYPIVSNERGIASTIFIRDKDSADFLWSFSKKIVQEDPLASDMQILFNLWRHHPEMVERLPIAPSNLYKDSRSDEHSLFDGYFDGHDFGVYIGGTNPWNTRGVSQIRSRIQGSLLDFDHDSIIYDKKRKFVSFRQIGDLNSNSLYSLHFTNKNPIFFTRRLLSPTLNIWLRIYLKKKRTFHPVVFALMMVKSLKRRLSKDKLNK